jgi:hypothetical protein
VQHTQAWLDSALQAYFTQQRELLSTRFVALLQTIQEQSTNPLPTIWQALGKFIQAERQAMRVRSSWFPVYIRTLQNCGISLHSSQGRSFFLHVLLPLEKSMAQLWAQHVARWLQAIRELVTQYCIMLDPAQLQVNVDMVQVQNCHAAVLDAMQWDLKAIDSEWLQKNREVWQRYIERWPQKKEEPNPSAVRTQIKKNRMHVYVLQKKWATGYRAHLEDILRDVHLTGLAWDMRLMQQSFWSNLESAVLQSLQQDLTEVQKRTIDILQIPALLQTDPLQSRGALLKAKTEILEMVQNGIGAALYVKIDSLDFAKRVEQHRQVLAECITSLQTNYFVVPPRSQGVVVQSRLWSVPIRKMVQESFSKTVDELLLRLRVDLVGQVIDIAESLNVMQETLQSSLDASLDLTRRGVDQWSGGARQLAQNGLEEVRERIDNRLSQTGRKMNNMRSIFKATNDDFRKGFIQDLIVLRENEKVFALRWLLWRIQFKQSYASVREHGYLWVRKTAAFLLWRFHDVKHSWKKVQATILRFSQLIRLRPATPTEESSLGNYVSSVNEAMESLPFMYRRAFKPGAITDARLFRGREKEAGHLLSAFTSWNYNHNGMLAVLGDRGSGISSFLRIAGAQVFKNIAVQKLVIPLESARANSLESWLIPALGAKESSLEQLESALAEQERYKVVLLEDIQELFHRTVHGIEKVNRLLLFASRTQSKIFWVFSSNIITWSFLNQVVDLSRFFSHSIELSKSNPELLEEAIIQRHDQYGIPLQFLADEAILNGRAFKRLKNGKERTQYLRNRFFTRLNQAADGNLSVAMLYWFYCIKDNKHRVFQVLPFKEPDFHILQKLTMDEIFVLAAVLQHEHVNSDELMAIMDMSKNQALLLLSSLKNRGVLLEKNGAYELHFILYKPAVKLLREKRLLV